MSTLINIPDEVEHATMEGKKAAQQGKLSKVPKEFKDSPLCDAWIVGWLAGKNGWDVEF